jgi:hypothetical protein
MTVPDSIEMAAINTDLRATTTDAIDLTNEMEEAVARRRRLASNALLRSFPRRRRSRQQPKLNTRNS